MERASPRVPRAVILCHTVCGFFFILARLAEKHCSYVDCSRLLPVPCLLFINSYTRSIIQSKIVRATSRISEPLENIA